jgi:hypothetical protein
VGAIDEPPGSIEITSTRSETDGGGLNGSALERGRADKVLCNALLNKRFVQMHGVRLSRAVDVSLALSLVDPLVTPAVYWGPRGSGARGKATPFYLLVVVKKMFWH